MNKILALIVLGTCSILVDVVIQVIAIGRKHPSVPPVLKPYLEQIGILPIAGILFGLFFGIGCKLALTGRKEVTLTEIVAAVVFAAGFQVITKVAAIFGGPLLSSMGVPSAVIVSAVYALLLVVTARFVFGLEVLMIGWFGAPLLGAALTFPAIAKTLPFGLAAYWFSFIGIWITLTSLRTFRD